MTETHPVKIIETEAGNIVMSLPDNFRTTAMSNSVFTYLFTDEDLLEYQNIEDEEEKKRFMNIRMLRRNNTATQLTILCCIESAPFHLNDYAVNPILDLKSFLEFADADLLGKLSLAIRDIGSMNPLFR